MANASNTDKQNFLPDFGFSGMMLQFVVLAEMIAVIVTIARNSELGAQVWQDLSLLSIFAMTIALFSAIVLKLFSPLLRRATMASGS
ncbi:MAG: hypothetical protein AAB134_01235, partial [Pseudomonadota bacterium]